MLQAVPLERRVQEPKTPISPRDGKLTDHTILSTFGNIGYLLRNFRFDINLTPIRHAFDAME